LNYEDDVIIVTSCVHRTLVTYGPRSVCSLWTLCLQWPATDHACITYWPRSLCIEENSVHYRRTQCVCQNTINKSL